MRQTDDLTVYILFNNNSVISGLWNDDFEISSQDCYETLFYKFKNSNLWPCRSELEMLSNSSSAQNDASTIQWGIYTNIKPVTHFFMSKISTNQCLLWKVSNTHLLKTCCIHHLSCLMTKPTKWLCTQRRLRSAWESTLSDQSLCCPHEESSSP